MGSDEARVEFACMPPGILALYGGSVFWARGLLEYGENLFFSEEGGCLCRIVETNGWDAKGGIVDVG